MSEEILINVTPRETRVALVENGMLQELHIERASRRGVVGNVYKGRVQRVMPGMQAAFVELGLERAAFLHASDILRVPQEPPGAGAVEGSADVPPPGQLAQHRGSIRFVRRLAVDLVPKHDLGVGAQHQRPGRRHHLEQAGTSLLAGHAADVVRRRLAGLPRLDHIHFQHAVFDAHLRQKFASPRGLRGQVQHRPSIAARTRE